MKAESRGTLARPIRAEGVGVHSGARSGLAILPAQPGTGIVFRRADLDSAPEIPARLDHVVGTEFGTVLGAGGVRVHTVEHLLAALYATRIDNAIVVLSGAEVPILDGSFAPWVELVRAAGLDAQLGGPPVVRLSAAVTASGPGGASYVAVPADEMRVSATIEFAHPAIGRQYADFAAADGAFDAEIASARTFGFQEEAESLRSRGFARGAALDNTLVLDADGLVNAGGLRHPDEFVRHKIGDLLGDLSLVGAPVRAHIVAHRPGHAGNVALARAVAEAHRRDSVAEIDVRRIMEYLPHRYPMLLVDRVVDFEAGRRIVGIKNVTINEPFFRGHFPDHPIMPGVLVVEAMAQVGGLLLMDSVDNPQSKVVYFMSLDKVKWRRPVTPGDQVEFEVELKALRRSICRMHGKGRVGGKVVAEAEMMARIVDK